MHLIRCLISGAPRKSRLSLATSQNGRDSLLRHPHKAKRADARAASAQCHRTSAASGGHGPENADRFTITRRRRMAGCHTIAGQVSAPGGYGKLPGMGNASRWVRAHRRCTVATQAMAASPICPTAGCDERRSLRPQIGGAWLAPAATSMRQRQALWRERSAWRSLSVAVASVAVTLPPSNTTTRRRWA